MLRPPPTSTLFPYTTLFRSPDVETILLGFDLLHLVHSREQGPGVGPSARDLGSLLTRVNEMEDRKSTRLNSSHTVISYAVFCLKKKTQKMIKYAYKKVNYTD